MSFSFLFWWLLFWYLLLSLAVAFYADQRGRNAFGFFFLGLFFTPVLAFLFATNNPNKRAIAQRAIASGARQCPFCAKQVKAEAIKCQHCGSAVGTGAAYRFQTLWQPLTGLDNRAVSCWLEAWAPWNRDG